MPPSRLVPSPRSPTASRMRHHGRSRQAPPDTSLQARGPDRGDRPGGFQVYREGRAMRDRGHGQCLAAGRGGTSNDVIGGASLVEPSLLERDAARRHPQGRCAPRRGGLARARPSLTAATHGIVERFRPGRRNGSRPNKETSCGGPANDGETNTSRQMKRQENKSVPQAKIVLDEQSLIRAGP